MRILTMIGLLALATPAAAQPQTQLQLDDLRAQQQAAERRAIDQSSQIQALDARLRADQASADLAAQRAGARLPLLPYGDPTLSTSAAPPPSYPSMPDAMLAASNQRVQDAARKRR